MMMQLAQELTTEGRYAALLVSMEVGSAFNDDIDAAEDAILATWRGDAEVWLPGDLQPPEWPTAEVGQPIFAAAARSNANTRSARGARLRLIRF